MHLAAYLLLAAAPLIYADVKFSAPAAGASLVGGTAITVTWADSGDSPSIADLTSYTLFLFSGSNASPTQLSALGGAGTPSTLTTSVTIPVTAGGTGTNVYFLGMNSVATAGGSVWNYSDRFTLTGMTGTFSTAVVAANKLITGTTGPDTVNDVTGSSGTTSGSATGAWATPYNEQTGLTKYAPMQPVPPTKITATGTSPLYPTSSVVIATSFLPAPSEVTTLTQSQTFSVSSRANTAAAAAQPSDDMAKFLNRWKD